MNCEKEFNRRTPDRQNIGRIKSEENQKDLENKNILEYGLQPKAKNSKPSMIPVKKNEKSDIKNALCKKRSTSSSMLSSASKKERDYEDYERKLKILKQKEKAIAGYYLKIQGIIQKMLAQKKEDVLKKPLTSKITENSAAKRMISEPFILSERRTKTNLSDFENNIQQISQIWLKTTSELSSTLKRLKSNPSLNPTEIQMENIRIQLAIKQAKSLTLVKTRNVIEEAKKLFRNREIIRTELECLLNHERCKLNSTKSQESLNQEDTEEQGINGTGDSVRESDSESLETIKETTSEKHFKKERIRKGALKRQTAKHNKEDSFSEEKESSDETSKEPSSLDEYFHNSEKMKSEMEDLRKEVAEKNKTITNLNKKIFDLQKTCNESSVKYNQLQSKLYDFHEKIQWNQVLWKQIGKLKDRIKSLQQSVKELEFHKRELETKMSKREQEIDKLTTLNQILSQKRHLINTQKIIIKETQEGNSKTGETSLEKMDEKCCGKAENKHWIDEKIIAEKQAAINQLKKILSVMKDQENFAQKQIHMFQSKIEELERR